MFIMNFPGRMQGKRLILPLIIILANKYLFIAARYLTRNE